jgi:hypothetical protein
MKKLLLILMVTGGVGTMAQVPCYVPTNGLVAWYPFNGNANDESGNGHDGIVHGATLATDRCGNPNSAYYFNGISSWITSKDTFFNNGWPAFTVQCWFNSQTYINTQGNNKNQTMINTIPHSGIEIGFDWGGDTAYHFWAGSDPAEANWDIMPWGLSAIPSEINSWHQMLMVKTNATTYYMYIDGQYDTVFHTNVIAQNYLCRIIIGTIDPAYGPEVWWGSLDDYGIWDRALDTTEIEKLYHAGCNYELSPASVPASCASNNGSASVTAANDSLCTYSWSNGGTNDSIADIAPGNYGVTVTYPSGCTVSTFITVSASDSLPLTTHSTDAACSGSNGSASVAVSGGVGSYSYQWSISADSTRASISNLSAGNYRVTVTGPGGCSGVASITVNQTNALNIAVDSFSTGCGNNNGKAIVTSLNGSSPFTYSWSNGFSTDTISNLASGTYFVTVHDVNGCSATGSTVVNSSGAASVSISTDNPRICANDSTQICATPGFTTYSWNTGQTGDCITVNLAGDYYVTATDNNQCIATSNHLAIQVYQSLSISISISGDTLVVYDGSTYQWYLNDSAIAGATSNTCIARSAGNYTVAITDSNSCSTSSEPVFITGIKNPDEDDDISVYPNPLSGDNWQLKVGNNLIVAQLEILDADGRMITQSKIENPVSKISFGAAKGVYLLRISSAGSVTVLKLIKL